jgi:hypothetical protein
MNLAVQLLVVVLIGLLLLGLLAGREKRRDG